MDKRGVLLSIIRVFVLLIAVLGLVIFGLSSYNYIAYDSAIEANSYSLDKISKNDFVKGNLNSLIGYYDGETYVSQASEKISYKGEKFCVLNVQIGSEYIRLYVPEKKIDTFAGLTDKAGASISYQGRVIKAEEDLNTEFYKKALNLQNDYEVGTKVSKEYALVLTEQDEYAVGMEIGGLVFIIGVIVIFCLSKVKKLNY